MRGYAAIGLLRPKSADNVGGALRAAYCYGAKLIAVQGARCSVKSSLDTYKAWRHIPVLRGEDLREFIPYDAVPVAVEIVEGATPLPTYQHRQRAFYVFGPEDGSIGPQVLNWCVDRVQVPTVACMNLAATVNVVLYDRLVKAN